MSNITLDLSLSLSSVLMPSASVVSGADCAPIAFIPSFNSLNLLGSDRWGNLQ